MTYKIINPAKAVHPYRKKMTEKDWDRLNRVIVEHSNEDYTTDEIEAYSDYIYDIVVSKKKTHYGTTVLQ